MWANRSKTRVSRRSQIRHIISVDWITTMIWPYFLFLSTSLFTLSLPIHFHANEIISISYRFWYDLPVSFAFSPFPMPLFCSCWVSYLDHSLQICTESLVICLLGNVSYFVYFFSSFIHSWYLNNVVQMLSTHEKENFVECGFTIQLQFMAFFSLYSIRNQSNSYI